MGPRLKVGVLLLVFMTLNSLAGCVSSGPPDSTTPATGPTGKEVQTTPTIVPSFTDITARNPPMISLGDALAALAAAEMEGAIDTRGMVLHQVFGYGVDSAGLARTWVLGMQREGTTILLEYSDGGWRELDLPVPISGTELKIEGLVTPQDLYKRHIKTIVTEMNRFGTGESELTLDRDTYHVTIHSGSGSSVLSFNAKTGELIPSA